MTAAAGTKRSHSYEEPAGARARIGQDQSPLPRFLLKRYPLDPGGLFLEDCFKQILGHLSQRDITSLLHFCSSPGESRKFLTTEGMQKLAFDARKISVLENTRRIERAIKEFIPATDAEAGAYAEIKSSLIRLRESWAHFECITFEELLFSLQSFASDFMISFTKLPTSLLETVLNAITDRHVSKLLAYSQRLIQAKRLEQEAKRSPADLHKQSIHIRYVEAALFEAWHEKQDGDLGFALLETLPDYCFTSLKIRTAIEMCYGKTEKIDTALKFLEQIPDAEKYPFLSGLLDTAKEINDPYACFAVGKMLFTHYPESISSDDEMCLAELLPGLVEKGEMDMVLFFAFHLQQNVEIKDPTISLVESCALYRSIEEAEEMYTRFPDSYAFISGLCQRRKYDIAIEILNSIEGITDDSYLSLSVEIVNQMIANGDIARSSSFLTTPRPATLTDSILTSLHLFSDEEADKLQAFEHDEHVHSLYTLINTREAKALFIEKVLRYSPKLSKETITFALDFFRSDDLLHLKIKRALLYAAGKHGNFDMTQRALFLSLQAPLALFDQPYDPDLLVAIVLAGYVNSSHPTIDVFREIVSRIESPEKRVTSIQKAFTQADISDRTTKEQLTFLSELVESLPEPLPAYALNTEQKIITLCLHLSIRMKEKDLIPLFGRCSHPAQIVKELVSLQTQFGTLSDAVECAVKYLFEHKEAYFSALKNVFAIAHASKYSAIPSIVELLPQDDATNTLLDECGVVI